MGSRAFTLLEILVCLAVMAVLASLVIPTTAAVREAAARQQARAQFRQWELAMEEFRAEYGYLPDVTSGGLLDGAKFMAALSGRDHTGAPLANEALQGNVRRIGFHALSERERLRTATGAATAEVVDGFGNSQIVVMIDRDGDGMIRGHEVLALAIAAGNSRDGFTAAKTPPESIVGAATTIPARVAFYSAGKGSGPEPFLYSWR